MHYIVVVGVFAHQLQILGNYYVPCQHLIDSLVTYGGSCTTHGNSGLIVWSHGPSL